MSWPTATPQAPPRSTGGHRQRPSRIRRYYDPFEHEPAPHRAEPPATPRIPATLGRWNLPSPDTATTRPLEALT